MSLASIVAFARETEDESIREWRGINAKLTQIRAQRRRLVRELEAVYMLSDFDDDGMHSHAMQTLDQLVTKLRQLKLLYILYMDRKETWAERHGGRGNGKKSIAIVRGSADQ